MASSRPQRRDIPAPAEGPEEPPQLGVYRCGYYFALPNRTLLQNFPPLSLWGCEEGEMRREEECREAAQQALRLVITLNEQDLHVVPLLLLWGCCHWVQEVVEALADW